MTFQRFELEYLITETGSYRRFLSYVGFKVNSFWVLPALGVYRSQEKAVNAVRKQIAKAKEEGN